MKRYPGWSDSYSGAFYRLVVMVWEGLTKNRGILQVLSGKFHYSTFCPSPPQICLPNRPPKSETGLQEFFDILWPEVKTPFSLVSTTFIVGLWGFNAFLFLLHSYLSVYFHLMYHLTLACKKILWIVQIVEVCAKMF